MKKISVLLKAVIFLVFLAGCFSGCASSGGAGMRIKAKKARVPYQGIRTIECEDCDIHLYHARTNCLDYEKELETLKVLQDKISDMNGVDFADVVKEALDENKYADE